MQAPVSSAISAKVEMTTSICSFAFSEGTKVYLQLRYGNKPLEVKKGKPTIELEDIEALLPTLNQIRTAIVAGEFDTVLMAAKKERAMSWKKGKK